MNLSACIVVYNGYDEVLKAAQTVLQFTRRYPLHPDNWRRVLPVGLAGDWGAMAVVMVADVTGGVRVIGALRPQS